MQANSFEIDQSFFATSYPKSVLSNTGKWFTFTKLFLSLEGFKLLQLHLSYKHLQA